MIDARRIEYKDESLHNSRHSILIWNAIAFRACDLQSTSFVLSPAFLVTRQSPTERAAKRLRRCGVATARAVGHQRQ